MQSNRQAIKIPSVFGAFNEARQNPPRWNRSRYGFALYHFSTLVLLYSVVRMVLYISFAINVAVPFADIAQAFGIGVIRDFYVALILTLPMLLWFLIMPEKWFGKWWHRTLLSFSCFLFWMVQPFLAAAEYYFFEEFESRFNTVAVDYLLYPHEVFINIWDEYPVGLVIIGCAVFSALWLTIGLKSNPDLWRSAYKLKSKLLHAGVVLGVIALMSPTIKLKGVRFSSERLLNQIADNGAVSFIAAAWTRHLDYASFYKTIPREEAYQRVRRLLSEPQTEFVGDAYNIRRKVAGDPNQPKRNIVIILEESLGSEFFGSLGRQGPTLTPEMDQLAANEGMLFVNIYASGNRTVRGFEGVYSSFPPLPGDSIVKRDLSENVETLARVLRRDGYTNLFLYGGRGIFDGMRAYAMNNGWDRFIEQKHFENPIFGTIWGVCDEDLFNRGIEEMRELHKTGKPWFVTMLTVSNHKPFTYPRGRIPEDPAERKRENAVKYTDYALGHFFRLAKQEPFWTNTIFVMVADHGARVYGSQTIPMHSHEIPFLIVGPTVVKEPARIPQLGGSLDVAPTILGLWGRPYETLFFGRDLLKKHLTENRVYLHHNRDIGLFSDDRMIILGLNRTEEFFRGNPKLVEMKLIANPDERDREIQREAMALYQVADELYINRQYKIDTD